MKKTMEHESDGDTNCNWRAWNSQWGIGTGTRIWKLEDEWRQSKLQHYWDRPEYREESCRLEETSSHSDSSGKPSANAGVKKSQMSIMIKTDKVLWYFEVGTNNSIQSRRQNLVLVNKKEKLVDW